MGQEKIFISYSRKDKEKVFEIRDEIEKATLQKCWIDLNGIESDEQFEEVIIRAINNADIFIFMYSVNSEKSKWTKDELRFASKKGKRIVFITLDGTQLTDWFLFKFDGHDIIDYSNLDQKQKLLRNLGEWCGTDELKKKEEEQKRTVIKEELVKLAKEYHSKIVSLSADVKEINSRMSSIGIKYRTCPICNNNVELANQFCQNCGYTISPIEGIEGAEFLLENNRTQYAIIRRKINTINDTKVQKGITDISTKIFDKYKPEDNARIILSHELKDVVDIHGVTDVDRFIRKFCSSSQINCGCSGIFAGLNVEELRQSLKCLYAIKMPKYDMHDSIWSLANRLWNENSIKFGIYHERSV